MTCAHDLRIRVMRPEEIAIAADWAAAEGWNPGLADAACFATVDPAGFLLGELAGAPAATISCVNYDERFAFLGFYIVRGDLRGRGYGLRIWNAAIAHAPARTIGLDGVVAQQGNYRKSGFQLAYANIRYGGTVAPAAAPPAGIVPLAAVPFATVEADDATVVPAPRAPILHEGIGAARHIGRELLPDGRTDASGAIRTSPRGPFLREWIGARGHIGRALVRDGRLAAWGVIRPCRNGRRIGPLVADDRAAAEATFTALVAAAGPGEVFVDVPSVNSDAVALAHDHGLAPVFETARMYTGAIRPVRLERVFGVTTFELG